MLIPLGIHTKLENGIGKAVSYLLLPRSSVAKTPLRMSNSVGLIDSGYRGELKIVLDNTGTVDYPIRAGEKLAQIMPFSGVAPRTQIVT